MSPVSTKGNKIRNGDEYFTVRSEKLFERKLWYKDVLPAILELQDYALKEQKHSSSSLHMYIFRAILRRLYSWRVVYSNN